VDLKDTGWDELDWIHTAHDREQRRTVVNTVMNIRVPQSAENVSTTLETAVLRSLFLFWDVT
jgi:hypothetical protein